jgi:cell division protein FtsB
MTGGHGNWYWIGLIILIGLLIAYAEYHDLPKLYTSYQESETDVTVLEQRLEDVKKTKDQLQTHVEELDENPLSVEAAVRENMGHVRKGETVYRIELPENRTP